MMSRVLTVGGVRRGEEVGGRDFDEAPDLTDSGMLERTDTLPAERVREWGERGERGKRGGE